MAKARIPPEKSHHRHILPLTHHTHTPKGVRRDRSDLRMPGDGRAWRQERPTEVLPGFGRHQPLGQA
jgi:hypothetical protein